MGGSSVWFTWTPPETMGTTIDLSGSDFDTLLAVYTGTNLSSLRLVASNDNASTGTNTTNTVTTSRVSFAATANTPYEIAVAGKNGAIGEIQLTLSSSTNQPISFTTQPQNQTLSPSGTLLLFGEVSGLAPLTYQSVQRDKYRERDQLSVPFTEHYQCTSGHLHLGCE